VDVALREPPADNGEGGERVTLGVLCDASRFTGAEDPVEWDVFRTGIHESQGWNLQRVWSPHFFRDPKGVLEQVVREAKNPGARPA
jgi:very-short-patch-repair endonuclease